MLSAVTYKSNWWGFIGKRVLIAMLAFFMISFAVLFTISYPYRVIKFDPPQHKIFDFPQSVIISDQLGYDDPMVTQYFRWLGGVFSGDWGNSLMHHVPVKDLVF